MPSGFYLFMPFLWTNGEKGQMKIRSSEKSH